WRDDALSAQQHHDGSLTRLEQRYNESEVRRRARRARGETDRLDSREHEHHHEDAANAPKGRDETDEEYESIERQRRQEAVAYEEPGRLVPARLERHAPGCRRKLERAGGTAHGQERHVELDARA